MRLGITGHRCLPPAVEKQVRTALADLVAPYDGEALTAVSCLADGPDAWFAEIVLARGGGLEVAVPADEYRDGLPESHHALYDALLARASAVRRTGLHASDSVAHQAGSEILVDRSDRLIAVWDGLPARGYGGTADVVAYARRSGTPVTVVWPEGATRD